jgi:hypothetical protein
MKKFLLIVVLLGSFGLAKAQDDHWEKVQALKIAFITQKLELSSDDAQKFWPVYNRYESEIRQVMKDNKLGGDAIDNEEKLLNVKKKYRTEFSKIIGLPKTNTLFNSEREFRGVLMRQLKGKDGKDGKDGRDGKKQQ